MEQTMTHPSNFALLTATLNGDEDSSANPFGGDAAILYRVFGQRGFEVHPAAPVDVEAGARLLALCAAEYFPPCAAAGLAARTWDEALGAMLAWTGPADPSQATPEATAATFAAVLGADDPAAQVLAQDATGNAQARLLAYLSQAGSILMGPSIRDALLLVARSEVLIGRWLDTPGRTEADYRTVVAAFDAYREVRQSTHYAAIDYLRGRRSTSPLSLAVSPAEQSVLADAEPPARRTIHAADGVVDPDFALTVMNPAGGTRIHQLVGVPASVAVGGRLTVLLEGSSDGTGPLTFVAIAASPAEAVLEALRWGGIFAATDAGPTLNGIARSQQEGLDGV